MVLINTCMKLQDIHAHLDKKGAYNTSQKDVFCDWLVRECPLQLHAGLTLMPKKVFYKHVPAHKGVKENKLFRHLTKQELEKATNNFLETLSRLAYKNGYKRFGLKIKGIYVIEGNGINRDFHSHLAFEKPHNMQWSELARLVKQALEMNGEFEIINPSYDVEKTNEAYRYKLDIVDDGWVNYITKELGSKKVHNVHFFQ